MTPLSRYCGDHRISNTTFADVVKSGYYGISRHIISMLKQLIDNSESHVIICTHEGIRKRFACCKQLLHLFSRAIEFKITLYILYQFVTVSVKRILKSLFTYIAFFITCDTAEIYHIFDIMFIDQMFCQFIHALIVGGSYKSNSGNLDFSTDKRDIPGLK